MSDRSPAKRMPVLLVACLAALSVVCGRGVPAQPPEKSSFDLNLGIGRPAASEAGSEDPSVEMRLTPETVRPGQDVTLAITVRVPAGSYTYSTAQGFGARTRIDVSRTVGLEPLGDGFEPDHAPKREFEPVLEETVEKHLRDVTWTRKYRVADAAAGRVELAGRLRYQVCDSNTCRPLSEPIAVTARVAGAGRTAAAGGAAFRHEERPAVNKKPGPAVVRAELAPANAQPGQRVTLSVTLELDKGWHTYAMWERQVLGASPTKIEVPALVGLKSLSEQFTPDREPQRKTIAELDVVHEVYHGQVTWTRAFEVVEPDYRAAGSVTYQVCDAKRCLLPRTVEFTLGATPPAAAAGAPARDGLPGETLTPTARRAAEGPEATPDEASAPPGRSAEDGNSAEGDGSVTGGPEVPKALIPFLLAAVGFGFASLLTPCVFPMIPITVSYFLKQSEKEHHRPVTMALVYCGGIVGTFTALGIAMSAIFGVSAMQQAANNAWLNLFFAGVLVFFALNMLGMFELRVPSGLLNWTSGKEARGGFAGVLFMAFTFTLVSFTCTFAFAGTLLVMAANGEYYWAAVGMLAFSAAFALPFFFLALFPSYLQKLPRSGGWMNRTKVTMGMVELALAFKFLSVADFSWSASSVVLDYAVVMSAWIILSVVTGLYLLGLFRLPHDTPSDHVSVPGFVVALFFLSFGAYLSVGLFATTKPRGALWAYIESFAPPNLTGGESGGLGPYLLHDGLEYALDYEQAVRFAREQGQPVFLDFTGINCINCRKMEILMGSSPELHGRLKQFVRVQLFTDNVPQLRDAQKIELILEKNLRLQDEWLRDGSLPSYAIATPDLKILARTTGLQGETTFAKFLDDGLAKWQQVAAGDSRLARR